MTALPAASSGPITVGVLSLQGAFAEHLQHLSLAASSPAFANQPLAFTFTAVRTAENLASCSALIIPGGESTTMALIASRSGLLEPLRRFVRIDRKPVWGTCAGLILLAEEAEGRGAKKGGQELIGGLNVRVCRNAFGRQRESFVKRVEIRGVGEGGEGVGGFEGVFIRAPVVRKVLGKRSGEQSRNDKNNDDKEEEELVRAPRMDGEGRDEGVVEVLAELEAEGEGEGGERRIVAVKQGNIFACSFHPELTSDVRLHKWWLEQVVEDLRRREEKAVAEEDEGIEA